MAKIIERIRIKNCDTLSLIKFDNSKNYFASFYTGKSQKNRSGMTIISTKTNNQKESTKIAKELWKNTPRVEVKERPVQFNHMCADIFPKFFSFAKRSKKEINMYKNYIAPIMDQVDVRKTDDLITAIEEVKQSCLDRDLKGKTIKKYINIVSLGLGYAQERNLLSKRPKMPSIDTSDSEDRPAFELKEIKQIVERIKEEGRLTEDEFYFEMADFVDFQRSVPVRPGKEPLRIKYKDTSVLQHIKYKGEKVLHINLKDTKTAKKHQLTVNPYFYDEIFTKSMQERNPIRRPETYLFFPNETNRDKLYERIRKNFRRITDLLGLTFNQLGQLRTLYSIRHTFFEERYKKGATMDSLAVMGNTSNEMLRKHYIKSKTFELHDEVYGNYYKKKYGS